MANEIRISLGGDAAALVRASQDGSDALQKLKKSAQETAPAIEALGPSIDKTVQNFDRFKNGVRAPTGEMSALKSAITGVDTTTKKFIPGANQAANTLTNLSRVAQDAPFGFIGIQNNLNPLLETFQRLKVETGSSGAAFKALAASLAGPAGFGLALGVVSGLVTVAVQKYGSLGGALDALFGSLSATEQANRDLTESMAESQGKIGGELATINALVSVAKNDQLSREARNEAINKLNKEYDEYLPKLTLENINTQQVTDSINKLNEALIRKAKIKGVEELITKETKKQAEIYAELVDQVERGDKGFQGLINRLKNLPATSAGISPLQAEVFKLNKEFEESEKRANIFNEALKKLITDDAIAGTLFDETKIKKGADALKLQITALERLKKALDDVNLDSTDIAERIIALKVKLTLRDAGKNNLSKEEVNLQLRALQKELNEAFKGQALRFESIIKVKPIIPNRSELQTEIKSAIAKATGLDSKIPTISIPEVRIKLFGITLGTELNRIEEAGRKIRETLLQSIQNGIEEGGNVLGDLFANIFSGQDIGGSLGKAAQSFLNIIGSVLQEVGKQVIATSTAVVALKKALSTLFANPVAGVAAGIGLVVLGGILKNIQFNVPKFAEGGIVTKPTLGIFGEAGAEAVMPLSKLDDMFAGANVTLQPSIRFSGMDFQIMLERIDNKRRRLG